MFSDGVPLSTQTAHCSSEKSLFSIFVFDPIQCHVNDFDISTTEGLVRY